MPSSPRDDHPLLPLNRMLNRAALILRYKQAFVDWINAVDPHPSSPVLTLADVEVERTVYLVEVEGGDGLQRWLVRNHKWLFEEELNGWYTDPDLWPRDRSLEKLKEWCSFELNSEVIDTGSTPLDDDDL